MNYRKIIHVDMDAFFASVEQRDFPELRGKPIAVGGNKERGVVAAASYEAREYGVRSAMPSVVAARKCPDLIFVKHRFDVYKEVSGQIREVFHEYTDLVEPLSLDEAFLDVTTNKFNIESATKIAKEIKAKIKAKTDLIASAGISINKFLAKVASDIHKPDGCTLIPPENVANFIEQLPIEKFYGIGIKTAEKMKAQGIFYGKDLKEFGKVDLIRRFGKMGSYYYDIANGIDERPVRPHRERKSYSSERTYDVDLATPKQVSEKILGLCESVSGGMSKRNLKGKTVFIKIRFSDFTTYTRQKTLSAFTNDYSAIQNAAIELVQEFFVNFKPVRLLGIGLSGLNEKEEQQITLKF